MSMGIETRLSEQIARYVDLAASEAKLTATNMANIDTPGYQAVGMDFGVEMRDAMRRVDEGKTARTPRLTHPEGLVARPDGNNVSMDRESLNLAEEQLRFRTGVALLKGQYQAIFDAIHVQDK